MSRLNEGESKCECERKKKIERGRERGRDHRQRSGIEEGGCWTMVEELSLRELQPPNLQTVPSLPRWFFLEMRKTRRTLIEENTYSRSKWKTLWWIPAQSQLVHWIRNCGVWGSLSVRRKACHYAHQRQKPASRKSSYAAWCVRLQEKTPNSNECFHTLWRHNST